MLQKIPLSRYYALCIKNMGRFDAEMGKIRIKLMATYKLSCCLLKVNNSRIIGFLFFNPSVILPILDLQFYCGRGKMENFIKEGKSGFDFAAVSSHSKVVDTIRLKLIKIAARAIHSARSITFKLCSSCPYKKEFYRTLENIQQLSVQLE